MHTMVVIAHIIMTRKP